MKYLSVFLILMMLASCQTYKPVSFFAKETAIQLEPGACYYSSQDSIKGVFRKARLIKIQEPIYKMVRERLADSLIAQYRLLGDEETIRIEIKEYSMKYRLVKRPNDCRYEPAWSYYMVCLRESPSQSKTFRKKELDSMDYFVTFQRLIKPAVVTERHFRGKEMGVLENQMYVPAGYYRPFKKLFCGSCGPGVFEYFMASRGYSPPYDRKMIMKARFEFGVEKLPKIFDIYFGL